MGFVLGSVVKWKGEFWEKKPLDRFVYVVGCVCSIPAIVSVSCVGGTRWS